MLLTTDDKEILINYFINRPILRAYLFGSFLRLKAGRMSDIDILVELDGNEPVGMDFVGYRLELEKLLRKKVGLVSASRLSARVRPFVDRNKVLIYERATN